MDSFIIYWVKLHCHLFVLMLIVFQIGLARAIQASLSFYTSSWFLILWHKMSQTHLDLLCLLVLACRQWGLCRDCLGLCSPGLILVMSSPHRNSILQSVLWLDWPLWFLGLWDTFQQQPSGKSEMSRCITHMSWRVQGTPGVTQRSPGWRERESSWASLDEGFRLFEVECGVSRILKFHSLLVNLKNKRGN